MQCTFNLKVAEPNSSHIIKLLLLVNISSNNRNEGNKIKVVITTVNHFVKVFTRQLTTLYFSSDRFK